MKFTKEVLSFYPQDKESKQPYQSRIVIRTNTYGSTLSFLQKLFDEAKKDFPHITPEMADIKLYGGRHYKGTFGIEFNLDVGVKIPGTYESITKLEYTMA